METFDAITARASVRAYQSKAVDKALLWKLVDAARRAPTARAIEPWDFVVIQDKKTLKKLGEIANSGSFIKDASACIVVFCADTKYYLEDGSAATENILLMAEDLGLGACWVAGDKKPYTETVSKMLGAEETLKLISLLPIGYPLEQVTVREKRPLEDVLHWEKYTK